jgi:hypothetical protein
MTKEEFNASETELTAALEVAMLEAFERVDCPLQHLEWFCTNADEIKNEAEEEVVAEAA